MDISQPSSTSIIMMPNQTIGVGNTVPGSSESHSFYLNTSTGDIYQKQSDNTYKIVENLTGPKGNDGVTPTNDQLLSLITPLIPAPIKGNDGLTPTNDQLVALITPLIPAPIKGNDGSTPTNSQLTALITPLIPAPIKGNDGITPTNAQLISLITPLIPAPVKGNDGRSVTSITLNGDYTVTFNYSDGTNYKTTSIRGAAGADGRGVSAIALNADYTLTFFYTDQTNYTTTSIRGAPGSSSWKDVKARLTTNASGVWTKTYAANFWTNEPSINVSPISCTGSGQLGWKITKTLASSQWTVTVTFTAIAASVTAVALGSTLNLTANTGTVTFDYQASETN